MISIIIPTYNNAKYLNRCLNSIASQTFKNYEVLIIDDGSTDDTSDICVNYSSTDTRFKYIKKENGGVSSARNCGLSQYKGDYVIFLDSDDYLQNDALEIINRDINAKPNANIVVYNNYLMTRDGTKVCENDQHFDSVDNLVFEIIERLSKDKNEWLRTIWAKVYKRSTLENIVFPSEVHIGQDACFLISVINKLTSIDEVMFSDSCWYIYDRTNEQSATHNYKKDLFLLSKYQINYLNKEIDKLQNYDNKRKNTTMCKFSWNLFWIMYYQGQAVKNNINCFKWYEYTSKYINCKDIYDVEFEDYLANKTFKYRRILSNKIVFMLFKYIYIARKK